MGNSETIPHFRMKHEVFKNSFFPSTIHEWNNLDQNIRSNITLRALIFSAIMFQSLYEPNPNSIFDCYNLKGVKLTTVLRPDLGHLRKHNFKNFFQG